MGSINISLSNGNLGGLANTDDGIVGMVLTERATDDYVTGTPVLITQFSDLVTIGITETNNPFVYRQIKEFYNEIANQGGVGAMLYFMGINSMSNISDMCDMTNPDGVIKLLNYAAGKIKIIGVMTEDFQVGSLEVVNGVNKKIDNAVNNLHAMLQAQAGSEYPCRGIIGVTSFNGTVGDLKDYTSNTTNRVGLLLGDTQTGYTDDSLDYNNAALGLTLGRAAMIPCQTKLSRISDGAVNASAIYFDQTALEVLGPVNTQLIAEKGYITFKTFPKKAGYYYASDVMTTANNDDYRTLSLGRVIDKAQEVVYTTLVEKVDSETPANLDGTGTLDTGFLKYLENLIISSINLNLTAFKNISGVKCFIDPTQNVVSTGILNIVIKITPVGYLSDIEIVLGYSL